MRRPTPTCGAARPTPGAASIVSNMSATSVRISSVMSSTGDAGACRTGSPMMRIGRTATSLSLAIGIGDYGRNVVWMDDLGSVSDTLVGVFDDPRILIGIPLALLGAVFMSFGAQYQHRGVTKVERLSGSSGKAGLSGSQLLSLLKRPSWVAGTGMLGLAIICQLSALAFAPLIIVQPIGAISLVITTLDNDDQRDGADRLD